MDDQTIVIVSGIPRSGTSMMMQMLSAGGMAVWTDQVRPADEHNERGYFELDPVRRTAQSAQWVEQAPGKAVKVIFRLLYHLPPDRPCRVVFMLRDLDDVVASQDAMLALSGAMAVSQGPWVRALLADALARCRAWLARQANMRVLYVEYGRVLEDPAGQARAVAAFVEHDLDVAAMAASVRPELCHQGRLGVQQDGRPACRESELGKERAS